VTDFSAQDLRRALGQFATGVTIVTCRDAQGRPIGMTCNSFTSVSLDPPLVLWCLRSQSPNLVAFSAASTFAVNVLGAEHRALSHHFASAVPDRFSLGDWQIDAAEPPVLRDAVTQLVCATESQQTLGDHVLFVGRVLSLHSRVAEPLVYHAGGYRQFPPTEAPIPESVSPN
jgi:flavin reductase (DIM6/NTAB) family NADH-FMN oxidoreductase RutF